MAGLLAESGTIALVSLVSPYAADREAAAELHASDDLGFLEIFVDTPLELCEQRLKIAILSNSEFRRQSCRKDRGP